MTVLNAILHWYENTSVYRNFLCYLPEPFDNSYFGVVLLLILCVVVTAKAAGLLRTFFLRRRIRQRLSVERTNGKADKKKVILHEREEMTPLQEEDSSPKKPDEESLSLVEIKELEIDTEPWTNENLPDPEEDDADDITDPGDALEKLIGDIRRREEEKQQAEIDEQEQQRFRESNLSVLDNYIRASFREETKTEQPKKQELSVEELRALKKEQTRIEKDLRRKQKRDRKQEKEKELQ